MRFAGACLKVGDIERARLRRALQFEDVPVIVIDYAQPSRWGSRLELKNLRYGYRITIERCATHDASLLSQQLGMICALGGSLPEIRHNLLQAAHSGVQLNDCFRRDGPCRWVASKAILRAWMDCPSGSAAATIDCSAGAGADSPSVELVIDKFGAERCAVVIGTSTSGIAESKAALRAYSATGALPESFTMVSRNWFHPRRR